MAFFFVVIMPILGFLIIIGWEKWYDETFGKYGSGAGHRNYPFCGSGDTAGGHCNNCGIGF